MGHSDLNALWLGYARRRFDMKKLFTLLQWLVVGFFVVGIAYTYFRPKPQPTYAPETWRSWKGFMAISYAGLARNASEKYPSPSVLLDHLRALRDAGYQPIRPEDMAAFLAGRHPLPERAILIFFEGGRKDSLIRATPMLQRTGFIGTMAVPTMYFRKWGSAYIKQPDLRAAARIPHWAFASMGHRAVNDIAADATGKKGRFLTHREWIQGRFETDDEFRKRITSDYYESQDLLETATGHPILVYLYPYGDAGAGPNADPQAAAINRAAVSTRFSLAFLGADDPFNGPDADPFSLTRLRVPGTWDGQRLVRELQLFEPTLKPVVGFKESSRWFVQEKAVVQNGTLLLGDQGLVWLRGSEAWSDVDAVFQALPEKGARISVYLRYEGPGSYVRFTVGDAMLRVQERLVNRLLGLALTRLSPEECEQPLRVMVRGRRAWVYSGDKKLLGPVPLSRDTAAGRIGIGCEGGSAQVRMFEACPNPSYAAFTDSYSGLAPTVQPLVQTIIVPWFTDRGIPALNSSQREDVLVAAAAGVNTIPFLDTGSPETPDVEQLVSGIAIALNHPVLQSLIGEIAIRGANPELSQALRVAGYRVLHILNSGDAENLLRNPSEFETLSRDRFLLDVEGEHGRKVLEQWLRRLPAPRLMAWGTLFAGDPPYGVKLAVRPEEWATVVEQRP